MSPAPIWHVVWTTWGSSPDWRVLQERIEATAAGHGMGDPTLQSEAQTHATSAVSLSEAACRQVENDIRRLTSVGADRIAGDTHIFAVAARKSQVQVVLQCEEARLEQVVGRLKSRTATLLSFVPAHGTPGKHTWSKGFARIRCLDEKAVQRAIDRVETLDI